jgi:hypothetical protein
MFVLSAAIVAGLNRDASAAAAATRPPTTSPQETVLFPFDDVGLPFNKGLILTLLPGHKSPTAPSLGTDPNHPGKPVVALGPPGAPDDRRIYFYGTVLHLDGEYRMWYNSYDRDRRRQICYAVSKDGIQWEKPKLGLVDYNGGTANNLIAIDGNQPIKGMCALVIHEPEDPNPDRRYKMIREVDPAQILTAVSPDGLRWKSAAGNKDIVKGSNLEPSGFIKFQGAYYLNGHGGPVPHPIPMRGYMRPQKRMMVTLVSYDFENWVDAGYVSFRRDNVPPRPPVDFEYHRGEQVHLGAGLWNRGNVILGFYGQYHNSSNDRRSVECDLGLIVSSDAIHFKEPLPDYKIVPAFEEDDRAEPRLTQAQGFQNIGDRTILYYGIWTEVNRDGPTGVRIATWPRDRLGYYSPSPGIDDAHCISSPLTLKPTGARVFVNATGLSNVSQLKVEILNEQFEPLPGYAAANCIALPKSGLRLPVTWQGKNMVGPLNHPVRIRVNWIGKGAEDARLFAVYVE